MYLLLNDKTIQLKEGDKKKLKEAGEKIKNIISLPGRIEHKKSSFISATMKGGWVFFDGIEMGHSILFDTISSLCNENPQLNVLDSKKNIILNKSKISPKFKFFLTFNPSNLGKKTINQILFNSCARFSLTTLDSNIPDSTVIIYNSRYNNEINKKLWINICSKLASCHKINVEKSEKYINLMANDIKFSPRHLVFLGNDGKKNVNISEKSKDISNWVKTIFQLYYFNSYSQDNDEKNIFSLDKINKQVIDEFIKKVDYDEIKYLEEDQLPEEVKIILKELRKIQKSNEKNIFQFNFRSFVEKCMALKINVENILLIINNIEDTLNLLIYQNDNYYQKYDENLSNFFQISIMKNLLKELYDKIKTLEIQDIKEFSLDSKELLLNKELKPILLRMKLLLSLLKDKELFTDKMNYKIYDERLKNSLKTIKSFIKNKTKKGFLNFIKECTKNSESLQIIDVFFPKHQFLNNKDNKLIILYIYTICELIRNRNYFTIEIDNEFFEFSQKKEYGKIQVNLCLNNTDSYILTKGTKINIPLRNNIPNYIEMKEDLEDSETIIRFINDYAPKKNLTKTISEIYNNFIKKKRINEKKDIFSSEYFFDPYKENNIYSRAWSIIYGLTPESDVYKFLLEYYFEKEKQFFNFIEEKYNSLDDSKKIDEYVEFFKKSFFYYNKKSFLWMNLIDSLNIDYLNKDEIKSKLMDIRKEIKNLKILENEKNIKIKEDEMILKDLQNRLQNKINKIEIDDNYIKAKDELYQLKNKINKLNVQNTFREWKNYILEQINDAFDFSNENMIKEVDNLKKQYKDLVSANKEDMSLYKNNIDWKIPSIKNIYEKKPYMKLYDPILQYNSSLEVIRQINEIKNSNDKSKIIKLASDFKRNEEFRTLIQYINYIKNYQDFDFEYANGICRASLMLKLYNNNISHNDLINFLNNIDEKKNRFGQVFLDKNNTDENEKQKIINQNIFLEEEFIYIYKITQFYELNMDIQIPKFETTDLIHIFFTTEKKNEYYLYGPAFVDIISTNNNLIGLYNRIKIEIKNSKKFEDAAGKIALIFYQDFNKDNFEIQNIGNVLQFIENRKLNDSSSENIKKKEILIKLIKLGIYFDEYEQKNNMKNKKSFSFEDFEFLNSNNEIKIDSILKMGNLPSFQYFLLNNFNNIKTLLQIIKKQNINKIINSQSYIPFWIFIIRIMSSTNYIIFENQQNPLQSVLTTIIREKFLLSMKEKKKNQFILDKFNYR